MPPLQPIFRYPLSYMSYHTFSFIGFMRNEVGVQVVLLGDRWMSPPRHWGRPLPSNLLLCQLRHSPADVRLLPLH